MSTADKAHALRVAGHLARALASYELEARRDGFTVPPELPALRDFVILLATARQDTTAAPPLSNVGDAWDMDTPLLTKREAAAGLRLSARTVERLIARGDLAAVRVGGRTLVRRVDLEAYVSGLGAPERPTPVSERIERKSTA